MTRRGYPNRRESGAVGGAVLIVVSLLLIVLLVWLVATGRTPW